MTKQNWSDLKPGFKHFSKDQYLHIIKDLYALNEQNRNFLSARFQRGSIVALDPYKKIIARSISPSPEKNQDLSLRTGKKAISDYKKATGDLDGTLELMVYYVECGHQFTSTYGDIDEPFYNSLISVYNSILRQLQKFPEYKDVYYDRLAVLARDSRYFGWGYDELYELFLDAFPEDI